MLDESGATEYLNRHLRFISERVGPEVQVIQVLDRAGWRLFKALQVLENTTLWHLPPYSPRLNPAQRSRAYLQSHHVSNRASRGYDDLFQVCGLALNQLTRSNCVRSAAQNGYRARINRNLYELRFIPNIFFGGGIHETSGSLDPFTAVRHFQGGTYQELPP